MKKNSKKQYEVNMLNTAFISGDIFLFAGEIIRRKVPRLSREVKEIAIKYVSNDISPLNTSYWRSLADEASRRLGVSISVRTAKYYMQDKHRN